MHYIKIYFIAYLINLVWYCRRSHFFINFVKDRKFDLAKI